MPPHPSAIADGFPSRGSRDSAQAKPSCLQNKSVDPRRLPSADASGPLNATVTTIARGCNVPPTANPTFCPPGRVQAAAPRCFSHRAIDGPFSKAARSLCKSPWRYSFSSQLLWRDSGCTHYTPGHWFVKRKSGIFLKFSFLRQGAAFCAPVPRYLLVWRSGRRRASRWGWKQNAG